MPRKIGFSTYSETFTGGDFTADEWEFVRAIAAYQKEWNRRYPSWREVLAVLESLGYRKVAPADGGKLEARIPKSEPDPFKAALPSPTPSDPPDHAPV